MADRRLVEYTEPRNEFGPIWTLVIDRSSEGPPGGLITIRHLDIEGAEQNAMTVVIDDLRRLDVATDWARGTSLRGGTDLDGATEVGPLGTEVADAGDFAARWNAASPPRREDMVAMIREAVRERTTRLQTDVDGQAEHDARQLERLRRLHHPIRLWLPSDDADYSFESYDDAADYATDPNEPEGENQAALQAITAFTVCAHCRSIENDSAIDRGYEYAGWPCRTAEVGGWERDEPPTDTERTP